MKYPVSSPEEFCRMLNITLPPELTPYVLRGAALYAREGDSIVDTTRLTRLNETYRFFRKWQAEVWAAAEDVRRDPILMTYCYFLYLVLYDRLHGQPDLPFPPTPDRQCAATDFAPLFSLLFFVEEMAARMEQRGLPFSVISDTLQGFDAEINDYTGLFGRPGMRIYVSWFFLFINGDLLRIGRLNYQRMTLEDPIRVYQKGVDIRILWDHALLHRGGMPFGAAGYTDEAGKFTADLTESGDSVTGYTVNEWGECAAEPVTLRGYREILRRGDNIISVHIPAAEPFTPELCDASFTEALRIFRTYYPDFPFRAFHCHSWMLERRLAEITGKESNITRFGRRFTVYPTASAGHDVYSFLFHQPEVVPPRELPETSSMQRKVKEYLCAGNHYYEKGGIIAVPEK